MATFNEVFERTEKKYRLSAQQKEALLPCLKSYITLDAFGQSTVTSLYLDTPSNDLICRSLEKPLYKEKIRLRRYGALNTMHGSNDVFLEIKKKYKGVVYKRRVRVSWDAASAFLSGAPYEQACRAFPLSDAMAAAESLSPRSVQISHEIQAFALQHSPLEASLSTACDRTAYTLRQASADFPLSTAEAGANRFPKVEAPETGTASNVRITFDDNIRYCNMRTLEEQGMQEVLLLPQGDCIMEIKCCGSMPLWLTHALARCDVKPTSFSKVGESFKTVIALRRLA
ncbi:MAG: polyphosphate polymerase domain-containing protein [Coriobacteriia bacterium]|nr:polyphosphate polymerase domain-containing protein [Coriobacteriia bacterium]